MRMHTCSEHDTCVCGCMSVEEAGRARGEENVRVRYIHIYFFDVLFYFIVILNVPFLSLEPKCQGKIFIFRLCILMNNKD